MTARQGPRVLVIASSEATLEVIRPLAENGELPTFQKFLREGNAGEIQALVPPITISSWATIVTGKEAGYHGVYDYWQRGPDGKFFETNGAFNKEKPIWQLLEERGLASGVMNVPCTYPPRPFNGFLFAGQDAPAASRAIAFPPTFYDEVVEKYGPYPLKDIFPGGRQKSDYLQLLEQAVRRQTDVLEHLVANKKWDFFIAYYSATAMAQHFFWGDMIDNDADNPFRHIVRSAYQCIDNAIARLIHAAGPDTITFVVSECGAGPMLSGVDINAWLEREGFLGRKGRKKASQRIARRYRMATRSGLTQIRMTLKRTLPSPLAFWINDRLRAVKGWVQSYLSSAGIDWAHTVAFSRGKEGTIFINLRGRDPHGVVNRGEEYEHVRQQIIGRLSSLIDPATGETAAARVYKADELYEGPMLEYAPDLIIDWRNNAYMPTEQETETGEVFVTRMREDMRFPTTGSHRKNGILLAMGPGIAVGMRESKATILDLVPTWLNALRQPIPTSFKGRVLSEIYTATDESSVSDGTANAKA